ncbi:TSUP family transporter [Paenochrobactrum sp. BZR 588]|uniref:TSUP family transporter n=1 Tax=unclassified Paenochrobactrum TaxID=2639760 RepID=UPI003854363A
MFEFFDQLTLLLIAAAFVAGIIDSIAGGGGMITIPALLLAGMPPVEALGTNKLQGLFGSTSATIAFTRKGHINLSELWPAALMSLIGSIFGALLATILPISIIRGALPILLILIALYFMLKPNISDIDRTSRMKPFLFGLTIVPLIGFYDGLFGPGTGSLFMLAFVSIAGYGILKATAHTKLLNCASNLGSFIAFSLVVTINWKYGLLMGIAQFAGAQLGASLAMRVGAKIIKPLLIIVSLGLAIRLMMEADNPIRLWLGF